MYSFTLGAMKLNHIIFLKLIEQQEPAMLIHHMYVVLEWDSEGYVSHIAQDQSI